MPRKSKYKKKYPIRRYKKPSPSRNLGPLGVKLKTKFIYNDRIVLNAAAGLAANFVFSANGVFDPNVTGGGHQPRGFDQLIGVLYDHCVVIASKITVRAANTDPTQTQALSLFLKDSNAVSTTVEDNLEQRYIKTKLLAPLGSGTNSASLSMAANPNKFLGIAAPLSSSELKNSAAANPVEQAFWIVSANGMNVVSNPIALDCLVTIEYTCICIEPRQPAIS